MSEEQKVFTQKEKQDIIDRSVQNKTEKAVDLKDVVGQGITHSGTIVTSVPSTVAELHAYVLKLEDKVKGLAQVVNELSGHLVDFMSTPKKED